MRATRPDHAILNAAGTARDRRLAMLHRVAAGVLRYGLSFLLVLWGGFKFTTFEAEGIRPLIENSPLLSWMYALFNVRAASALLGVFEISTGLLIALHRRLPRASGIAGVAASGMFLVTLSFLATTPGVLEPTSPMGGFLMEDLLLLGAALYTASESLRAASTSSPRRGWVSAAPGDPAGPVTFARAGVHDLECVLDFVRRYYEFDRIPYDDASIRRGLAALVADPSLGGAWLIRQGGAPVGYFVLTFGFDLEFGGRQATVTELYLRPESRRGHVGTATLRHIEEYLGQQGIEAYELQVESENLEARAFYARAGFEAYDRIPMSKRLVAARS